MKNIPILLLAAILLASCASYHVDTEREGKLSHVTVGIVDNRTREGELGGLMKRQLQEYFSTAPGFQRDPDYNWLRLDTKLVEIKNRSIAETETREKSARTDESEAYQTVLHRIEIKVEYEVINVSKFGESLLKGKVIGTGDVPFMHDRNVSLKQAYLQAISSAAIQIKEALADYNLGGLKSPESAESRESSKSTQSSELSESSESSESSKSPESPKSPDPQKIDTYGDL